MPRAHITILHKTDVDSTGEEKLVIPFADNKDLVIARQEADDIVKSWFEQGYVVNGEGQSKQFTTRRYIAASAILAIELKMES